MGSVPTLAVHRGAGPIVLVLYVRIIAFGVGDLANRASVQRSALGVITGVNLALVVWALVKQQA